MRKLIILFTLSFVAGGCSGGDGQALLEPLARGQTNGARERPMGCRELKHLTDWNDGRPGTELNFKFYRQATNKIVGISDGTASFLRKCFEYYPDRVRFEFGLPE